MPYNPMDFLNPYVQSGRISDLLSQNDYGSLADLFLNSRVGQQANPANAYSSRFRQFNQQQGQRAGNVWNVLTGLDPNYFGSVENTPNYQQFYNAWQSGLGSDPTGAGTTFGLEKAAIQKLLGAQGGNAYFGSNTDQDLFQQVGALLGNRLSPAALRALFSSDSFNRLENAYAPVSATPNAPTFIQFMKQQGWLPGF